MWTNSDLARDHLAHTCDHPRMNLHFLGRIRKVWILMVLHRKRVGRHTGEELNVLAQDLQQVPVSVKSMKGMPSRSRDVVPSLAR